MPTKIYRDSTTGRLYTSPDGRTLVPWEQGNSTGKRFGDDIDKANTNSKSPSSAKSTASSYDANDTSHKVADADLGKYDPARWDRDPTIRSKILEREVEEESEADRAARLKSIEDFLNNQDNIQKAWEEEQKAAKVAREKKVDNNFLKSKSIREFKTYLRNFIADQIQEIMGSSYAAFNAKYEDSGLVMPGRTVTSNLVPEIAVYIDWSGSWLQSDIKMAKATLRGLEEFVAKGLLKLRVYYWSGCFYNSGDNIYTCITDVEPSSPQGSGSTPGQFVMDHIKATKPTNVIIMTDSDWSGSWDGGLVTLLGGVFFLWKNGKKGNCSFPKYLRGRRATRDFNIFADR